MIDILKEEIIKAVSGAGIRKETAEQIIETPPKREMGDFALPCFRLAAEMKKAPQEIARELKEKIGIPNGFRAVEIAGPYLNFFIDEQALAKTLLEGAKEKRTKKGGKKIIVEYCQANPMKAFHIGHMRNICIGESLARIMERAGMKVFRMDYGGDVGPHVSKTLYAYRELQHKAEPKDIVEKEKWLGELYAAGAKSVKENPRLEEKMREMVVALEHGKDKKLKSDWKKLREASLMCFHRIFRELGVKFDRIVLESEVEKEGIELAKKLEKEGFAVKDQGAILVDLEKHGLGKFLILKSDGAALYSSKDLALARMKKRKLKTDETIIVVGAEQNFYFQQLTKTLELLNARKNEYCMTTPLHYELVAIEGGKMSSREGNVITYAELFETVAEKTVAETLERHPDWPKGKITDTAKKIALAAIKFGMLAHDRNKVITFNWENALRLEGDTGPFIQYSYARANSILRKAGKHKHEKTRGKIKLEYATEKNLVYLLAKFRNVVDETWKQMAPNKMTSYLTELAQAFNSFYHEAPVLQAPEPARETRLGLVTATAQTLKQGASLLNIELAEEM